MKSEIIFSYSGMSRGRYREISTSEIVIEANFDNPAAWPFILRRKKTIDRKLLQQKEVLLDESIKLSKALYEKIKQTIEKHSALRTCEEHIETGAMDGTSETFYFSCNAFSKRIGGVSICGAGHYEAEKPTSERTDCYVVYKAFEEIQKILKQENIN